LLERVPRRGFWYMYEQSKGSRKFDVWPDGEFVLLLLVMYCSL
jgi:hypothetical protein